MKVLAPVGIIVSLTSMCVLMGGHLLDEIIRCYLMPYHLKMSVPCEKKNQLSFDKHCSL